MPKDKVPILPALPWSLHKTDGWMAHWDRVERWYGRLMTAQDMADVLDFSFAFFRSCA